MLYGMDAMMSMSIELARTSSEQKQQQKPNYYKAHASITFSHDVDTIDKYRRRRLQWQAMKLQVQSCSLMLLDGLTLYVKEDMLRLKGKRKKGIKAVFGSRY
jgi:hypothetical protein